MLYCDLHEKMCFAATPQCVDRPACTSCHENVYSHLLCQKRYLFALSPALHVHIRFYRQMSDLVAPTATRPQDGGGATAGGGAPAYTPPVAELAGEAASPPPATFTAIMNIKCPDQTGVVRLSATCTSRWFVRYVVWWGRGDGLYFLVPAKPGRGMPIVPAGGYHG